TVLGSCVSVILWDRKRKAGGINHFQLPTCKPADKPTARFGDVSTATLIRMMVEDGSRKKHLEAQIFGGAYNSSVSSRNVGGENIRTARRVLSRYGIRIVSEDVGGERGRKVIYDAVLNEVAVLKVEQLRKGDWHPYLDDR
ncbi:MAG: chemotaxis protein CheD, partial [Deltaproteobacteria bacterium]|nr:chemotaxis protein CheD [Deltaproteobacteria bacterium]